MVCVCRCVIVHESSTTYIYVTEGIFKNNKILYLCVPLKVSILVFITFLASGKLDQNLFIRLGNVCFPTWISVQCPGRQASINMVSSTALFE
jgi:hypothetical protein